MRAHADLSTPSPACYACLRTGVELRRNLTWLRAGLVRMTPRPVWAVVAPILRRLRSRDERHTGEEFGRRDEAFSLIYRENLFGDPESRSGCGSTLAYTAPLRKALPLLIRRLGATSMLDAPCGDFNWMCHVEFGPNFRYHGRDIVPELIADVTAKHAQPGRDFGIMDIVTDPPPDADLWLCRDVLFHLPNSDAVRVLQNFARSQIRYLLTTSYDFIDTNHYVQAGGFRFLNLRKAPFDLPEPLMRVADFVVPQPPRNLCLWSLEQIRSSALGRAALSGAA